MSDERVKRMLRGLAGGALLGAGLLSLLVLRAGDRVALATAQETALGFGGFIALLAALGAWLGWLHGAQQKQQKDAGAQPTALAMMQREGAMGLRVGFVVGLLYVFVTLGIFLGAGPVMPLWLLALRAGMALAVLTLGVGAVGFVVGYAKSRAGR